MAENPPAAKDKQPLEMFATVGIGPGVNETLDNLDAASQHGFARAAAGGWAMVEAMLAACVINTIVNGWILPPPTLGRQGPRTLIYAAGQSAPFDGIMVNDAAEAVHTVAFTHADGQMLDGANRYTLRFEGGRLPPAHEFWSLTMYDPAHNLVDNPINRYAIRIARPLTKNPTARQRCTCSRHHRRQKGSQLAPDTQGGAFNMALRTYGTG